MLLYLSIPEKSFSGRSRYQSTSLPSDFSDEEMARDWTLSEKDTQEIVQYRKDSRLFVAVQVCAIRLYGRFLGELSDLSPRIINYLNIQLNLPPSLAVYPPDRRATYIEQRKNILTYLGFRKFDEDAQKKLSTFIEHHASQGKSPIELLCRAETHLLSEQIILLGPSVLDRLVASVCATVHEKIFESVYRSLSSDLKELIEQLLAVPDGEHQSYFHRLKEYPPKAKISSLKSYLERYNTLEATDINNFEGKLIDQAFLDYLFRLTKNYSSKHLKRFKEHKRYAMMVCFMLESQKVLLDHLVKMHDQYLLDMCRHSKNAHEQKHREFRKRQKKQSTQFSILHIR
jgi:Domain of unknown function (DUF4158)